VLTVEFKETMGVVSAAVVIMGALSFVIKLVHMMFNQMLEDDTIEW